MNHRRLIAGTVAAVALVLVLLWVVPAGPLAGVFGHRQQNAASAQSASVPTASDVAPPPPSPVSTQATLSSTCNAGIFDQATNVFTSMSSIESSGFTGIAAGDLLNEAYQVTLTNTGSVTAEVNGLSVILYAGTNPVEIGSDSENVDQTFIAPGQSLTWTERPWNSYTSGEPAQGPFSAGQVGAVDPTGTCSLVQWTHP